MMNEYQELRAKATAAVAQARKNGELEKPLICELCDREVSYSGISRLMAHHWNGYHNFLDIWWICGKCNSKLQGRHDGSFTKEQAKEFVKIGYKKGIVYIHNRCKAITVAGNQCKCSTGSFGQEYCYRHR